MFKMKEHNKNDKTTNMITAAFMLFIFPIVTVFIGAFLGGYIGKSAGFNNIKTAQIIGGIVAFILVVILIKLFDKSAVVDENQEKIHWDDM
ncbi:SoxR reducing system RseC family protein [Clostridium sp. LBM24168]